MPGHMSGQIVFGQALFEAGEWDEARTVFERALTLDPENLIALRSLGDMALQAGNTSEARTWYSRLLEADPKDAAVIELMTELDESSEAAASPVDDVPGVDTTLGDQQIPTAVEQQAQTRETTQAEPEGLERHYPTEAVEEEPALAEPPVAEPFVNETMAQLYLQQGYRQLALSVYRQLSASRPQDQALKARIAEIEAADAADHPTEVPAMRRDEPSIETPAEPAVPRSPAIESPSPWSQPGSEESPGF